MGGDMCDCYDARPSTLCLCVRFVCDVSCDRKRYHGQGQVITLHSICGIQLLLPALDSCFWHKAPDMREVVSLWCINKCFNCNTNSMRPGWQSDMKLPMIATALFSFPSYAIFALCMPPVLPCKKTICSCRDLHRMLVAAAGNTFLFSTS